MSIIFKRVTSTLELEKAVAAKLADCLKENKKVLWLVTGGSNIQVASHVMASLPAENLANLIITLTDERYGEPGHADSNQKQLEDAGFQLRGATFIPYLSGLPLPDTVRTLELTLSEAFGKADIIIGLLGMGPDGHIAGILPESDAAKETEKMIYGYDGGKYKRITLTNPALCRLNSAYLGVFGKERLTALLTLQNGNIPSLQQPAQILKKIPECFIYNDQVG